MNAKNVKVPAPAAAANAAASGANSAPSGQVAVKPAKPDADAVHGNIGRSFAGLIKQAAPKPEARPEPPRQAVAKAAAAPARQSPRPPNKSDSPAKSDPSTRIDLPAKVDPARAAIKPQTLPAGPPLLTRAARQLAEPRVIALLGSLGAIGVGAAARMGIGASLLESVFWSGSFLGLGLGAASFARLSRELGSMRNSLDHTRKHMATTARVLSETLEQAETMNALSRETALAPAQTAGPAPEPVNHQLHLEGLANVARAQVILAHKSEADMSVLSTLVSDLAEAVAEQEKELQALRQQTAEAQAETAAARLDAREAAELIRSVLEQTKAARPPVREAGLADDDDFEFAPSRKPAAAKSAPAIQAVASPEPKADPDLVSRLARTLVAGVFDETAFGFALQPVVTLPQRKVKFYELGLVLKADAAEPDTASLRRAAREAGIAAQYDRMLVGRAFRLIRYFRSKQKDITIFCQVTGAMLVATPAFDDLVAEFRRDPAAAQSLVIGFSQSTYGGFRQAEHDLLRFVSEAGVHFGVADLKDMRLDPLALSKAHIRIATIDVATMLAALPTGLAGLDVHVADLAGLFARRNIDFVVQNISTEQDLLDVMDLDTPLAQGRHLGEPRPINAELTAATQPPPPVAAPAPAPVAERQPLRNFLRRA
ncbi:MAG: EAL domain-containing protein [Beijerinckiaceae bacterium]|nr:EAL domain-containing protein [Beijerinckiaceae bacterium]